MQAWRNHSQVKKAISRKDVSDDFWNRFQCMARVIQEEIPDQSLPSRDYRHALVNTGKVLHYRIIELTENKNKK